MTGTIRGVEVDLNLVHEDEDGRRKVGRRVLGGGRDVSREDQLSYEQGIPAEPGNGVSMSPCFFLRTRRKPRTHHQDLTEGPRHSTRFGHHGAKSQQRQVER